MKKKLGIIAILILIDQISKLYIYNTMEVGEYYTVIDDLFYIKFHLNDGAAWGIFSGNLMFLTAITVVVIVAIGYYLYKNPSLDKLTSYGLVLYLAGAIGNFIDRVRLGAVIDFFDFTIPIIDYDFPIFNVADMLLVCGFILIFFAIIKERNNGE